MEKLIDLFCHVIRITDPLSIQIAVGMVGGGIPLLFLYALFILLGELTGKTARSHDARFSQASPSQGTSRPAFSSRHKVIADIPASNLKVRFTPESGHWRPLTTRSHSLFGAFALYLRCVFVDWLLKVHAPLWSGFLC